MPTNCRHHRRCSGRTTSIARSRRTFQLPTRVQTHIEKSMRPPGGAKCVMCHAPNECYCFCTQTNKGPTLCEHPQPTRKTQKGHKHRDRETHSVSKGTQPKDRQRKGPEQHQTTDNMEATIAYSSIPSNKSPRHDRAAFQTANTDQDVQNPRDR